MPVSNELLEYQKVDGELRKIDLEIASGEERKKYVQARRVMKAAMDRLDALNAQAGELLRLREQLSARLKEASRSLSEYDDLDEMLEEGADVSFYKKNAQALQEDFRAVKNDLQRLLKEINAITAEYKKLMEQGKQANKQYKENKTQADKIEATYSGKKAELQSRLEEMGKKIDPRILEVYEQKRKEKIFPVVVPLNGEYCVCGRNFPLAQKGELAGGNMVECENCRRLVYKL